MRPQAWAWAWALGALLAAQGLWAPGAGAFRVCVCRRVYRPVCASTGRTYGNACVLDCARALGEERSDAFVRHRGRCTAEDLVPVPIPLN
ncbi:hypothetical protein R5R35_010027 [Gryllus longicercus]|uniref:Kazal-like domain-containing protein n=1 Tax=Gryllus longicercus TaxID=2509291 RepID=A0AAN9VSU0_9ORTH